MRAAAVLQSPIIWDFMRGTLDRTIGLYSHRIELIREWGVLTESSSLLDIGCGTGHYAAIAPGRYLGIDLDETYIEHAKRKHPNSRCEFRCADLARLTTEAERFNITLAVDVLHHLPEHVSINLLRQCGTLTTGHILSFEPVREQSNRFAKWIIDHDRGDFIRSTDDTVALLSASGLQIIDARVLFIGPIRSLAALCRPPLSPSAS
jgi:2-polyprenyl-3-methyl-5-hydroxy-6-metoxy-1,4-benzoquinol methylase